MRLPLSLYGAALHVLAGAALPARLASLRPLAASNPQCDVNRDTRNL